MRLGIKSTWADSDKVIGGLEAMDARLSDLSRPLNLLGLWKQRGVQRDLRSGAYGIQSRTPGGLAASVTYALRGLMSIWWGSNKEYARSQNEGPLGGIYESSRPGGFLAIPIMDALGAGGRPKAEFTSPERVADGFFFKSKKGNLLFGRERIQVKKVGEMVMVNGKLRRRRKFKGKELAKDSLLRAVEILFVLKELVRGTAWHYCRWLPDDKDRWDKLSGDWVLKGR